MNIGLKEYAQQFAEYLFDKLTISPEIEVADMQEYLRPVDIPGRGEDLTLINNYPQAGSMRPEELFNMIIKIEYLFYQNMEKTRNAIVKVC